ncbi:MAG: thioredoxin [Cyanobacteria bacterium REEB459]|nr:thioredoxin [Cyanobacteria bacterium REEB459]
MTTAAYIETDDEFDSLIASPSLVVVDFTATWCGPCKMVGPLMDQLAAAYGDRLQVFKVDLDAHSALAKRLGIRSIPAVMLFKQGEVLTTLVGVKPYEAFTEAVDQHL